jgi:hypothetical protein
MTGMTPTAMPMTMPTTPLTERPADFELIARVADTIAVPKAAPADSFVLHAPLELMARVGLLPFVAPERRADAMAMIEWLGDQYADAGDPVEPPRAVELGVPSDPSHSVEAIMAAVAESDLDTVDALAASLLPQLSAHELIGLLGERVVTSLAAAGHAPIGMSLLTQVSPRFPAELLRGALRGIASHPEWRIHWHDGVHPHGDPSGLYDALRSTPQLGRPGSDFIFPLMSQVQDSGVAATLLTPVLAERFDVTQALHTLSRVATWSMVHDDPGQAPYGWSHALTMPQAVMSLAGGGVRPRTALAVAATFLTGFRAAHGTAQLPEVLEPEPREDVSVEELATAAALHEDAHLVKYTLACLHAMADDPAFRTLHLAAAVRLVDHWSAW